MSPLKPIRNDDLLVQKARTLADCPDVRDGQRSGVWPPKDKPHLRRLLTMHEHAIEKGDAELAAKCEAVLRAVVYGGESAKCAAITKDLDLKGDENVGTGDD